MSIIEEWRNIQGYDGYQVSNLGRVRSLDRWVKGKNDTMRFIKGSILKLELTHRGYLQVSLYKNGKQKRMLIHRLVAMAFIPNTDNLSEINHKDENPLNNCVNNLEWCTHDYNLHYGTHYEKVAAANTNNPKTSKAVVALDPKTLEIVFEFPSMEEAKRYGFNNTHIGQCCKNIRKTHKGFEWRFRT